MKKQSRLDSLIRFYEENGWKENSMKKQSRLDSLIRLYEEAIQRCSGGSISPMNEDWLTFLARRLAQFKEERAKQNVKNLEESD